MSFFKVSMREKITAQIVREANQVIDRDIETGEWFTKVHGPELIARTNDHLSQQINRVVTRVGIPSSVAQLMDFAKRQLSYPPYGGWCNLDRANGNRLP